MESIFIWMYSTLQEISNGTKNTKFGVQTKKLFKLQFLSLPKIHGRDHNLFQQQLFFFISQCGHDHMVIFGPAHVFNPFWAYFQEAYIKHHLGQR